jgi:hypothetical protein
MIQRIFPRQGERGGLSHHARAPWPNDEGGKILLPGPERHELRRPGTIGHALACASCWIATLRIASGAQIAMRKNISRT